MEWQVSALADRIKELINLCRSDQQTYFSASNVVDHEGFRVLFAEYAARRHEFQLQLTELLAKLGVELPPDANLETAISANQQSETSANAPDLTQLFIMLERSENLTFQTYASALQMDFDDEAKTVLQRHSDEIIKAQDRIRHLRDAYIQNSEGKHA